MVTGLSCFRRESSGERDASGQSHSVKVEPRGPGLQLPCVPHAQPYLHSGSKVPQVRAEHLNPMCSAMCWCGAPTLPSRGWWRGEKCFSHRHRVLQANQAGKCFHFLISMLYSGCSSLFLCPPTRNLPGFLPGLRKRADLEVNG